ncbi:MAG: serine/threonine protein kinase, partial [Proteobacteria bacterium]|nr:serine/threonine protein kinase [Pseudomonadota bacterium]
MFKVKRILGSGATAVVCLAEPEDRPTEAVALKVLHQDLVKDLSALNRMRDEAAMLRGLHHPHILGVNQLLDYDGRPVVEMEYVKGVALDMLMRKFSNGLPGGVALSVGTKIAVALDAAYYSTQGPNDEPMHIIHRDLKPSNVLLSTSGAVKVVDFGLAKARFEGRQSKTLVGVVGTREFMPPEVLLGEDYTSAVDVYSLAMTLFNLLTGKMMVLPRRQEAHDQTVARSLPHLNPPALPDIVIGRLRELLANMLLYVPEERPELCDVAGSLQMLVMHPEVDLDLGGFAAREVLPLYKTRGQGPPRDH